MANSVEIVDYSAAHAAQMKVRDLTPEFRALIETDEYRSLLETVGPGYTLLIDDRPIAALVFVRLRWPGTAEACLLADESMERYGRVLHRICKRCIEAVIANHGFHRVECRIDKSFRRNRRWVESLGFRNEGIIHQFGPNKEDYIQYGWWRD
jgi:hypothetical protein